MVSWQLSRWIDTTLTLAALERALASWQPQPGWIHHSDRRVQCATSSYVARLEQIGARRSMAAKGIPYDNANAESCFETLKLEEANLTHFIDDVYIAKCVHFSLLLSFHPRRSGKMGALQIPPTLQHTTNHQRKPLRSICSTLLTRLLADAIVLVLAVETREC